MKKCKHEWEILDINYNWDDHVQYVSWYCKFCLKLAEKGFQYEKIKEKSKKKARRKR